MNSLSRMEHPLALYLWSKLSEVSSSLVRKALLKLATVILLGSEGRLAPVPRAAKKHTANAFFACRPGPPRFHPFAAICAGNPTESTAWLTLDKQDAAAVRRQEGGGTGTVAG
jgi:hypothetical protein